MPTAPIYGRVGREPLGMASFDVGPRAAPPISPIPRGNPLAGPLAPGSRPNPLSGLLTAGNDYGAMIRSLIASGQGAGVFSPTFLRDMLRRQAIAGAGARGRRSVLLSRLAGADPYQSRQAMIDTDIESSGQLADALNNAELQGFGGYQEFIRSLLGGERGGEQARQLAKMQAKAQREAQRGNFLGGLGGILG